MAPFKLSKPLPKWNAYMALRDEVIRHLTASHPPVASPFESELSLMKVTGLSRPTVRRAMERLAVEGWIERRAGRGMFVGPRVAMTANGNRLDDRSRKPEQDADVFRLGVLIPLGSGLPQWYARPHLLAAFDAVSLEERFNLDVINILNVSDVRVLRRRLEHSRPDVVVVHGSDIACCTALLGECQHLGIHTVGIGAAARSFGLPSVEEDGRQGVRIATEHLLALGHRRIGMLQVEVAVPWTFDRVQGYRDALTQADIEVDENMVLWLCDRAGDENRSRIDHWFRKHRPTAIVAGIHWLMKDIGELVEAGAFSVPEDISVVAFNKYTDGEPWLGGAMPAHVAQPLLELAKHSARMGASLMQGLKPMSPLLLPCTFHDGPSVSPPAE